MQIETIPLSKLVPSPANVRKAKSDIGGLAASIMAHGLLQNLQVCPNGGTYEVVAGGRRLAALKYLAKQKKIAADSGVACDVREGPDATEISLAENEMREAMHPADQFEAFKKLIEDGKGEEEIAARFGVTPHTVRQRLKLAVVSPKLIAAYRKGAMTLDCLMAFTVADDHRTQEKVWAGLPDYARQRADAIRDALTEKHIAADSKLARFVGMDAYDAVGGAVLRDLFDADNAGWLTDRELVEKLAAEKLETGAATVRGEGWKWVEIMPGLDWEILHRFGHAVPERSPPTEAQQREIETLTKEGNAIIDEHGEEPEDETALDRLYAIQERVAELSEGEESWPDAAKAEAGAVIGIGHNGELAIHRGLIRPEDRAAAKKAAKAKTPDGTKTDSTTAGLSAALIEQLTAHRTAALQARLADNPKVALAAVVHALALPCLYRGSHSCLLISAAQARLSASAEGIESSTAGKQLAASTKAATKGMPKQPEKLWAWLIEQDQKALLAILAICAATTVDAVEKKRGAAERAPASAHTVQLGQALKLDMADYWQPTAEGYFGNVPKTLIIEAVREAIGPGAADKIASLRKDAMAKRAAALIKDKGWLPAILR